MMFFLKPCFKEILFLAILFIFPAVIFAQDFGKDTETRNNCTLCGSYALLSDQGTACWETRAIFDEGTGWITEQGAQETIKRIKRAGFNVYIPCVWHGDGTRFPSKLAPTAKNSENNDLNFSDGDPLFRLISIAHQNGIQVHPWICLTHRSRDFLQEYYAPQTPRKAFDAHRPEFRRFMITLALDIIERYAVDGINLDFVRTKGLCTCNYCTQEYRRLYRRDLIADSKIRDANGGLEPHLQEWQDNAIREIIYEISKKGKLLRPSLILSVDGRPRPSALPPSPEGRQEIKWANDGFVDIIFNMDYSKTPDFEKYRRIRQDLHDPSKVYMLLGNYEWEKRIPLNPSIIRWLARYIPPVWMIRTLSRDPELLTDLVNHIRNRWPGGVGIYLYSALNDAQIEALAKKSFDKPAKPMWLKTKNKNY